MFSKVNMLDVVLYASDADKETFVKIFVVVGIILIFFAIIGFAVGKKKNEELYGSSEIGEKTCVKAKVVSKRTAPNPISPTVMVNWIVFEFNEGERLELAIRDSSIFGVIVEGDEGELEYQGKKFVDFRRNV